MRTSFLVGCLLAVAVAAKAAEEPAHGRMRRYALEGSYWGVRTITYKFISHCRSLSDDQLARVFKKAFQVWEEKTGLTFVHKTEGDANIDILFATGRHGDDDPFDGKGRILAHGFFPRFGGNIHIDDDELWSEDKHGPGLDLYSVAVHEIGHVLGLKHTEERSAVMAPKYQKYTGDRIHLHEDDLAAIDLLYGPDGAANRPRDKPFKLNHKISPPDLCKMSHIDAITQIYNGTIYVFKGPYVWELSADHSLRPSPPRLIKDTWGFDGPVDAVLTVPDGNIYLFKRIDYYIFTKDVQKLDRYPRLIRKGLTDTPDSLDAATSWLEDGRPYFFKDNKYWPYSQSGMETGWPRSISNLFRGSQAPDFIDAALYLQGTGVFLFSGQKYWQITGKRRFERYPRAIAQDWFNCFN